MANAVPFALMPALVTNDPIDYSTSEGIKLWKGATAPLYGDPKDFFDMSSESLLVFMSRLEDRSKEYGWNDVLEIPDDIANPVDDEFKSLTQHYGLLDDDHVREHVQTYIDQQTRQAQNSAMLYKCVKASLTEKALAKVDLHKDVYTIGDAPDQIKSGAMLVRLVSRLSQVDTKATVSWIRTELSSLDKWVEEKGSNVEKLNLHIMSLVSALEARGEESQDLMINIFKAYDTVGDKAFNEYVKQKKYSYEEGTSDFDTNQLMEWSENFYKTAVREKKWQAPTAEDKKIVAMEAQIKSLSKQQNQSNGSKSNGKGNDKKKQGGASGGSSKKGRDKPKWMSIPPKAGEPHQKTVNGKIYYWCPIHQAWVRHMPDECKGIGFNKKNDKDGDDKKDKGNDGTKRLRFAQALQAVTEDSQE